MLTIEIIITVLGCIVFLALLYSIITSGPEFFLKTLSVGILVVFIVLASADQESGGQAVTPEVNSAFTWITVTYVILGFFNFVNIRVNQEDESKAYYGFIDNFDNGGNKSQTWWLAYILFSPAIGVSTILEVLLGSGGAKKNIVNKLKDFKYKVGGDAGGGAKTLDESKTFKFLNYFFYRKNRSLRKYTDEDTGSKVIEKTVLYSTILLFLTAGIPLIITGAKGQEVNEANYYHNIQPVLTVMTGLIILLIYGTLESADPGFIIDPYKPEPKGRVPFTNQAGKELGYFVN